VRGAADNPQRGKRFGAVLGIVGAFNIPLIHMSVQWFRSLHPQPVIMRPEGPQADPEIVQTLLVSLLGFTLAFFALLLYRYGLERVSHAAEIARVRRERRRPVSVAEGALR
jgi:heme exporter protein C